MGRDDRSRPRWIDLGAALGLLTRLPMQGDGLQAAQRGAASAWAWPLAGALVGALAALAGGAALAIGLAPGFAAALMLATQAMVTGAMHEDGLADSADGLWGGWDRSRRLEIMKDSHIGSYGVLALLIVLLARWSALVALAEAGAWCPVMIAAGALSRVPMAVLMAALPNARGSGLSQSVGRPPVATTILAVAIGLGLGAAAVGILVLPMALIAALPCIALALVARTKIGGQTGDILGASQQLAETAVLALAAARAGA